MARKNRYEYAFMRQMREFLCNVSFRSESDLLKAERLLTMIDDFLDMEHVTLSMIDPPRRPVGIRENFGIGASQGWMAMSPPTYVESQQAVPSHSHTTYTDSIPIQQEQSGSTTGWLNSHNLTWSIPAPDNNATVSTSSTTTSTSATPF